MKEIGLGGAWWDSAGTEAGCIEAIHRALDLGIDYFDTYPELEPWWEGPRRDLTWMENHENT